MTPQPSVAERLAALEQEMGNGPLTYANQIRFIGRLAAIRQDVQQAEQALADSKRLHAETSRKLYAASERECIHIDAIEELKADRATARAALLALREGLKQALPGLFHASWCAAFGITTGDCNCGIKELGALLARHTGDPIPERKEQP